MCNPRDNSLVFVLRVNLGITVNLGSGRDQEPSLGPLGQSEHVHGAHERGLDGLDRVVLVVRGRGGTGEMVNLVDLDEEGLDDVVPDHFKVGVTDPVGDLGERRGVRTRVRAGGERSSGGTTHGSPGSSEKVVQDGNFVTEQHQSVDQMRTDETGSSRDYTPTKPIDQSWFTIGPPSRPSRARPGRL